MIETSAGFREHYHRALVAYVEAGPGEVGAIDVFGLGRAALSEGRGLTDLLSIHQSVLPSMIVGLPSAAAGGEVVAKAEEFLTEVAAPFEMTHRGWHEVVARLQRLNQSLESEVAARTAALRDSERRFHDIAEVSGDWMWETDGEHRFTSLFGESVPAHAADPRLLLGKTRWDAAADLDSNQGWARHKADLDARRPFRNFRYVITTPAGERLFISSSGKPVFDDQGNFLGYRGTASDETIAVEAQGRAEQAEARLAHAQKMEAIGNLTGGMAHDFNNLLGIIIGNLDLLGDLIADRPAILEFRNEALDAAQRGADLTRRLLAFARRQPLRPEPVAVNTLVSEITKLLTRMLGEDIVLSLDLADDLWPVTVDPAQLEAAITNLATNARDAMPRGGHLTFATRNGHLDEEYAAQHAEVVPGDYVIIEVTDTGTGMAPETVGRVFEPFFTTKETGKGTGLGLSMVFGFIRQSGGHINVYSEPGVGTTFRLYLPRGAAAIIQRRIAPTEIPTAGKAERILVVEDNPGMLRIVVRQLTDLKYRVLSTSSAVAALEILSGAKEVDLLLTDIVMPGGMTGLELAAAAAKRRPQLKVLLTSGFPAMPGDRGEIPSHWRLLSKPYRLVELANLVREALDDGPSQRTATAK